MNQESNKPFWEKTYQDDDVSTFSKGPTGDIAEFYSNFKPNSIVLDVGCGEGRNSIFLAKYGHSIDAFDISHSGISKSIRIAQANNLEINFFQQDIAKFDFAKQYDVIMSTGVLHLPEKAIRNNFITSAQKNTNLNGFHVISIFTNRLPATPDNAPFTKSLFNVGEIVELYKGWEIARHKEGTFKDEHPGEIRHEHAYESIIARKR